MLAQHSEIQRKVVQELKEVFGTADTTIDYESLSNLTYLDMVLKETMRLFPVLPVSARKSAEEIEIGKLKFIFYLKIISSCNHTKTRKQNDSGRCNNHYFCLQSPHQQEILG